MDLNTVAAYRAARTRADLALAPGERLLGGGTWLYSEPQVDTTGLVDLTTMGWPALERVGDGLRIAATCTIAELARIPPEPGWGAHALFLQCANALLASFKVWNVATVGGNVCRAFAAGAMVSLCTALDAEAVVWTPDGRERRRAVEELVTGNGTTSLRDGEVLRALEIPAHALRARTAFRKIALAELGRSGAVVIGRVDADGRAVFSVTAAVERPAVLRYETLPEAGALAADIRALEGWYSDPFGAADWRRHVSGVLAAQVREELAR
ncbi:FAD binding domain-containing protein [Microbacterium karelineae]|uniref:FAD binding domain-containing protein n=1 Tax=Microbacterium karelineae TaxID=2654283 RepID=UPI0012E9F8B7|nr:FAD binding domain-containing protein [Microbacterium karelineae]